MYTIIDVAREVMNYPSKVLLKFFSVTNINFTINKTLLDALDIPSNRQAQHTACGPNVARERF
jgi:hypothetical protein